MLGLRNDIKRLNINVDFIINTFFIHNLLDSFQSFKQRKRDIGIKDMSFEALHVVIGEENTALKFEKKNLALAAVNSGRKNRIKSKNKSKLEKDYVVFICRTCCSGRNCKFLRFLP